MYHVDVYCYPGQPKLHLFKGIFLLEFIVGWCLGLFLGRSEVRVTVNRQHFENGFVEIIK